MDSLDIGEHLLTEAIDLMLLRNSDIEKISEARDLRLKIGGLAQMTEKNCYRWTRFTKDQLVDLLPRLRLPETFSYRYGDTIYRMPSELAIIIFFTRLATGDSYNTIELKFGVNEDYVGGFIREVIIYLYCHFFHKISGRLMHLWMGMSTDF